MMDNLDTRSQHIVNVVGAQHTVEEAETSLLKAAYRSTSPLSIQKRIVPQERLCLTVVFLSETHATDFRNHATQYKNLEIGLISVTANKL